MRRELRRVTSPLPGIFLHELLGMQLRYLYTPICALHRAGALLDEIGALSAGFAASFATPEAPSSAVGGEGAEAGFGCRAAAGSDLFRSLGWGLARPGSSPRRESMKMPLMPPRGVPWGTGGLCSSVGCEDEG